MDLKLRVPDLPISTPRNPQNYLHMHYANMQAAWDGRNRSYVNTLLATICIYLCSTNFLMDSYLYGRDV